MGNCGSGEQDSKFNIRLLVLGTAACGKSTFARQMKIIYCDGFNEQELSNYKTILQHNLCLGLKELVQRLDEAGVELNKKVSKAASFFLEANAYQTQLSSDVVDKAKKLWTDKTVRQGISQIGKFEFTESLDYVMENLDRISSADWTPTNQDVLHVRQRTTGMVETQFKVDKYTWTIVDVGGQKVERRKWVHSQQGMNALIFFVALDEYDVTSEDEPEKTKMEEALDIWDETVNSENLAPNLPVILFLNKQDLFREKLEKVPLKKTYKKYKGGKDFDSAVEFIHGMFLDRIHPDSKVSRDEVYYKVTCAIDTEQIRFVFDAVRDFIFRQRLKVSGL